MKRGEVRWWWSEERRHRHTGQAIRVERGDPVDGHAVVRLVFDGVGEPSEQAAEQFVAALKET